MRDSVSSMGFSKLVLAVLLSCANLAASKSGLLDPITVVVLPIELHSDDAALTAVHEEFSDQLLRQLMLVDELIVVSGAEVAALADDDLPEEDIASAFGASKLLTGSITEDERYLRFSISFIDALTGELRAGIGKTIFKRNGKLDIEHVRAGLRDYATKIANSVKPREGTELTREERLVENQAKVRDESLDARDRIQALGKLRYAGEEARKGPVAAAAARMAKDADNPSDQMHIWQYLKGANEPLLIEPLTEVLQLHLNPAVRAQAANTLEDYRERNEVRAALAAAAADDPSPEVRRAAAFSLATDEGKREISIARILDAGLSDRERLAPFGLGIHDEDRELLLTDEVVQAMIDMAARSDDAHIRTRVWLHLPAAKDASVVPPLLWHLTKDPSPVVREVTATALAAYLDHPSVRPALESAQETEVARSVLRAIRKSLQRDN